jgi:hypothetical protein
MKKDDGGPAFPNTHGNDGSWSSASMGMSLRDYFAGQVISGPIHHGLSVQGIAQVAYQIADTLLMERDK